MLTMDLTSFGISSISWAPTQPIKGNRNASGVFRGKAVGALLLDFTVETAVFPYQEGREFEAYSESFEGAIEPFEVIIPVVCFPSGEAKHVNAGAISVISGADKTLITTGWPANTQNIFLPGDLMRLPSPSKTYKVAMAAHSDATGQCAITFTRAIYQHPAGGEMLIFNPATITVTQSSAAQEYKIPNTKNSVFEIDLNEVVI